MSEDELDDLLQYVRAEGRVCPHANEWDELWHMLPDHRQAGTEWAPPQPLILGAFDAPALLKMLCLERQIRYAAERGLLSRVSAFLRALPPTSWHYLGQRDP